MIAGLSMRLHHLITDVESYSLCSGRQRIIGYLLLEYFRRGGGKRITVTLPTNKGVIASRLNLTQEHFSRILHELSEKGLIVVEGRRIHIPMSRMLRIRMITETAAPSTHPPKRRHQEWQWKPRSS
jgi:CRP-like cAMP-binding protein